MIPAIKFNSNKRLETNVPIWFWFELYNVLYDSFSAAVNPGNGHIKVSFDLKISEPEN